MVPRILFFAAALVLCASPLLAQSEVQGAKLTFTAIDVPGAGLTTVSGINTAGDMVGWYSDTSNSPAHGFLLSGSNFSFFDYPGGDSTFANGINDSGTIAGYAYLNGGTASDGFLYDGTAFTTVRVGSNAYTLVRGINNAGFIVGGYGSFGGNQGFEKAGSKFRSVTPPGSYTLVYATGINTLGQIVGTADDGGFSYVQGRYKTISVPGSSETQPLGINDSGIVVGWYVSSQCIPCGFVYRNGKYFSINYPNAVFTGALGISPSGQIVGSFSLDGNTIQGFVTSPVTSTAFQ